MFAAWLCLLMVCLKAARQNVFPHVKNELNGYNGSKKCRGQRAQIREVRGTCAQCSLEPKTQESRKTPIHLSLAPSGPSSQKTWLLASWQKKQQLVTRPNSISWGNPASSRQNSFTFDVEWHGLGLCDALPCYVCCQVLDRCGTVGSSQLSHRNSYMQLKSIAVRDYRGANHFLWVHSHCYHP